MFYQSFLIQETKYATQSRVKVMLTDMFDKAIMYDFIVKNPAKGIQYRR